jgi:hypothetical protein
LRAERVVVKSWSTSMKALLVSLVAPTIIWNRYLVNGRSAGEVTCHTRAPLSLSFGKWTRRAWMGCGYLVARQPEADGVNSRLVDRFGEE